MKDFMLNNAKMVGNWWQEYGRKGTLQHYCPEKGGLLCPADGNLAAASI